MKSLRVIEFFDAANKYESGWMGPEETTDFFQWMLDQGVIWNIPQWQPKMAELLTAGKLRVN